jgi:hypothetical protein
MKKAHQIRLPKGFGFSKIGTFDWPPTFWLRASIRVLHAAPRLFSAWDSS